MIVKYKNKIRALETEIKAVLKQEEEEKHMRLSEMAISKARNMIEHRTEILSRPARTWIQGEAKKRAGPEMPHPTSKRAKREEIKKKRKKPETVSQGKWPIPHEFVLYVCIA